MAAGKVPVPVAAIFKSIRSSVLRATEWTASEQIWPVVPEMEHDTLVSVRLAVPLAFTMVPRRKVNARVRPAPGGASANTTSLFNVHGFGRMATTAPVSAADVVFDANAPKLVNGDASAERS